MNFNFDPHPLQEVTNVRKRRHCGFPNSIEILWRGGKREFLTSFLSRDEAYRLIMIAWHNNRYCGLVQLFRVDLLNGLS